MSPPPEVLIVDDDPVAREMLAITLGQEFTVRMVATGVEAIEALIHQPPAAMLLDVAMPGVDGYDVLEVRQQRGLAPDTCVIMLSAADDERSLVRSWALGADAFLNKPVDPERIAQKLWAHLDAARAAASVR